MAAWLKNASETEKPSSMSRSRTKSGGRRQAETANGATNRTQSGIHRYQALTWRPNAPG